MPRYRSGYKRSSVTSSTGAISENAVVFQSSGGHTHDGSNSSLIETNSYSVWDFQVNTVYSTTPRADRQNRHIEQFRNFISNHVNNNVLEPAGIVLGNNVINANNIVAGSISSELIAANTIVANNIAANTITTDLLAADAIQSDNYSYTSGNFTNAGSFFNLSDGSIRTDSFYLDGAGNMYIAGDVVIGATAASTIESGSASGATSLQPGEAASDVNSNTTTISGGKIRTGNVESTGFVRGSGTYSTTGTRLDLDTGDIIAPNFRLFANGVIYAQSGNFSGTVNASGGTFTGKITAGLTEVGTNIRGSTDYAGIALRNDSWENAWVRRSNNSVYFRAGSSTKYIQVDTTGTTTIQFPNFSVNNNGNITATGATITGTINATSGTFSGSISSSATITGGTVQTASSGARIVLSGTQLNLYSPNSTSDTAEIRFNPPSNVYKGVISSTGSIGVAVNGQSISNPQFIFGNYLGGLRFGTYFNFLDTSWHTFRGRMQTSSTHYGNSWSDQQLQVTNGSGNAGIAIRATNDGGTVQIRVGASNPTAYFRNHTTGYSHIDAGNIYSNGSAVLTSSRTIKENIVNLSSKYNSIELINNISPVTFNYIKEHSETGSGRTQAGFIAEEIKEIFPESVIKSFHNKNYEAGLYLDSMAIIALCVESIKDLSKEVDSLKRQIKDLP
jgi:energy-converting hydrogenase Eha subunit F